METCQLVRRCGGVWFRDVLLWYDRGWIPVLVKKKKKINGFTNTTDENTHLL